MYKRQDAALIGLAQSIALLPGISRLALTYVAAAWLGIEPITALLFSLTIECVLILGAAAKALYDVRQQGLSFFAFTPAQNFFIVLSSIIAYGALEWVAHLAGIGMLPLFGWYLLMLTFLLIAGKKK